MQRRRTPEFGLTLRRRACPLRVCPFRMFALAHRLPAKLLGLFELARQLPPRVVGCFALAHRLPARRLGLFAPADRVPPRRLGLLAPADCLPFFRYGLFAFADRLRSVSFRLRQRDAHRVDRARLVAQLLAHAQDAAETRNPLQSDFEKMPERHVSAPTRRSNTIFGAWFQPAPDIALGTMAGGAAFRYPFRMFVQFFSQLKQAGVPVTLREYLTLMEAMEHDLAGRRVEDFYYLSRSALVKDERNLDKFDRVFGHVFKGLDLIEQALSADIPEEWLRKISEKYLTEEEKKMIEAMGGLDKLLETLRKRLEEQKGRHQGGKKWIGTGGTSPFGNAGYNPEGIRIGGESTHRRAVKVWDRREFKDLDDQVELGTRNIKIALRRLRKFARTGAPDEFDLDNTVKGTAQKGYLDIHMRPERHNTIKVLALFDIGGSMDWHVKLIEELFSAAKAEFKHLVHFYFHNCLYEKVWKENRRIGRASC